MRPDCLVSPMLLAPMGMGYVVWALEPGIVDPQSLGRPVAAAASTTPVTSGYHDGNALWRREGVVGDLSLEQPFRRCSTNQLIVTFLKNQNVYVLRMYCDDTEMEDLERGSNTSYQNPGAWINTHGRGPTVCSAWSFRKITSSLERIATRRDTSRRRRRSRDSTFLSQEKHEKDVCSGWLQIFGLEFLRWFHLKLKWLCLPYSLHAELSFHVA